MPDEVVLRDGTAGWVWPLEPTDREQLADEFAALSPESRRQRFLSPVVRLTGAMLDRLVDEVDGVDHVALVLFAEVEPRVFDPVGIARIVRYPDLDDAADLAITVKDDWQGRGVASALLPVLMAQRPAGVTRILTEVATDNPASLAVLRSIGPMRRHAGDPGVWDVEVELVDDSGPHPLEEVELPLGERLHALLADATHQAWRQALRLRDVVCQW